MDFYERYNEVSNDGAVLGAKINDEGYVYFDKVREFDNLVILYYRGLRVAELLYKNIGDIVNFTEED